MDGTDTLSPEGEETDAKKSKLPLILGLVFCILAGGGGFYATYSGMFSVSALLGGGGDSPKAEPSAALEKPTYVSVGEMVIPLGPKADAEFLLLTSEIEVDEKDQETFEALVPRVRDLFNTYLRAIEARDLEQPDATARLRDQLLRRLRVVAEPAAPRDLLFTSFILK